MVDDSLGVSKLRYERSLPQKKERSLPPSSRTYSTIVRLALNIRSFRGLYTIHLQWQHGDHLVCLLYQDGSLALSSIERSETCFDVAHISAAMNEFQDKRMRFPKGCLVRRLVNCAVTTSMQW